MTVLALQGRLLSSRIMTKRGAASFQRSFRIISSLSSRSQSSLVPAVQDEEVEAEEWQSQSQASSITLTANKNKNNATSIPQQTRDSHEESCQDASMDTTSPSELVYTGNHRMPITSILHIVTPEEDAPRGTWPIYRIMDDNGHFRDPSADGYQHEEYPAQSSSSTTPSPNNNDDAMEQDGLDQLRLKLVQEHPDLADQLSTSPLLYSARHDYPDTGDGNTLKRALQQMIRLREMDTILQNAQRQGRISFYMTCQGEEAVHLGAACALDRSDVVLAQYREAGILMWRGFTLEQFTNQCFSNDLDLGKGRQMPVHYGSRALNYQTISSPLGTQLPQAVGAAYHYKLSKNNSVAACFFGDGCASTTDFHSALNFAATLEVPVLFICRNNGYAISTPVTEQYKGDGIVARAPGYGMAGIRVDGNDVFAVAAAVQAAKAYAVQNSAPVVLECMTYRRGHHSTSDDSSRYRSAEEVLHHEEHGDPLHRLQAFMQIHGLMEESDFVYVRDLEKLAVLQAMEKAEQRPKPPIEDLFEDVYEKMPLHLQRQEEALLEHMNKYPKHY